MKDILTELKNWNCDIKEALERFSGNEDLYLEFLMPMALDENFAMLGECLEKGDTKSAFEHAHALKGALGNMGLTPLYDVVVEIVEPLRGNTGVDVKAQYKVLMELREEFENIIKGSDE